MLLGEKIRKGEQEQEKNVKETEEKERYMGR
jgi:hypothetical protein